MKKGNFILEYILLGIAVLFTIASLSVDWYLTSKIWFSRSGSILVLLSVIVEYRIAQYIYNDIQKSLFINKKIKLPIPLKPQPQKEKVVVARIAHSFIVLGTLIWGYGDLLLN